MAEGGEPLPDITNGPMTDPENGQPLSSEDVPATPPHKTADLGLEKLISRVRSDSVYELRKLRHQLRPVSEFTSKQALEHLLGKRNLASCPPPGASPLEEEDEEARSHVAKRVKELSTISKENAAPATSEMHMPVPVRLEIRGLFEQRRVSGLLSSSRAVDIERALQSGIERHQRRQQRRRVRARPVRRSDPQEDNQTQAQETEGAGERQGRGPRPMPRRHVSSSSPRPRPRPRPRHAPQQAPSGQQYRVPRRDQSFIVRQLQQSPALNSLQPSERDRVLTEVGSLVQQQLVSSALSGEFRGVLELHIQNRAEQIQQGLSGQDITNTLNRRSGNSARQNSSRSYDAYMDDEVSSASMAEMRQEIQEMKSQLMDLKQMLRTSFDLQLEIQRAVRQEVAAGLSAACAVSTLPTASSPHATRGSLYEPHASTRVVDSGLCTICSEASIDSVVYRCGHMCVCVSCGLELKAQGLKCPICRAPITDVIRAYSSMQ